jgi:hypothetical protein
VVATHVGGIAEQVRHGLTGVLVENPTDLAAFGQAVTTLIEHPARARTLGHNGHVLVRRRFLTHRQIIEWVELLTALVDDQPGSSAPGPSGSAASDSVSARLRDGSRMLPTSISSAHRTRCGVGVARFVRMKDRPPSPRRP